MDSPLNPQGCKSPHDDSIKNMSGTQSPESKPFDGVQGNFQKNDFCTECPGSPFEINNTPLTDIGRPSLALDFNSDDMLTRESLGILPDALLCRDSLSTRGLSLGFKNILNTSIRESLGILNTSTRESLGILNLSDMDFGRESIDIFNIQNVSQKRQSNSFASELGNIRNRIRSLPVHLEDNNYFADNMMETRVSNVSVCDDIICRGIEDENDFDDLVFLEAKKVVSIIADTSFIEENSFELKEKNILDMIPQPEWTTALDSPNSHTEDKAKSPKWDQGTVSKKIDKMFGLHPVSLEEKLKSKNDSKTTSPLAENTSQNTSKIIQTSPNPDAAENQSKNSIGENISRISRTSQGENQSSGSNNFSQNYDENASRLLQNLSDILNEKDNLSISQMSEVHRSLMDLAGLLGDSKSEVSCSSEDSDHSSVHSEDRRTRKDEDRNPPPQVSDGAASNHNEEACQVLDLSCRSKSSSGDMNKKSSVSNSPALNRVSLQYLLKTPNRLSVPNTSATSVSSNTSDPRRSAIGANRSVASNSSNASGQSGNVSTASRHSNISQNRVSFNAVKLRKSKVGVVVSKKGRLRAVLPVEKMAKGSKATGSPERNDASKLGLRSKKTSIPIQKPKLKPKAASTPALRQSTNLNKEQERSPLARQKYTRSFSYQPASTSSSDKPDGSGKSKEKTSSTTKTTKNTSQSKLDVPKPVRRNSITEGTFNSQSDSEGPIRIKRSLSTGKESKIMTALGKVRQSILNSPYYNPRKCVDSVLTEYAKQSKTDLKGSGTELKRLSSIDKMFGLHPVSLEEKLKSKNDSKTTSPLAENTSQNTSKIIQTSPNPDAAENQSKNSIGENISRISRTSQGENQSSGSNNFSQNYDENASRLLQNLSDILNEKDNLSISQMSEVHRSLMDLAGLLGDSKSEVSCSSEDSDHSSVHSEDRRTRKDEDRNPPPQVSDGAASNHNEEACQVLDLSCRSKSSSGDMNKKSSVSNSPALNRVSLQYLLKTPNRLSVPNTSATSVSSNTSDPRRSAIGANRSVASNSSNASGQSGNVSTASRHSNISQNRVSFNAVKLRKSKVGVVVSKKGRLRAVLPVEKMAKGSKATGSPERNDASKLGLRSKKTSIPIQKPKLKPKAASTPALRQSTNLNKEQERSPLARQKYTRSFSYQPASTSSSDKPDGSGKSKEKTSSTTKTTKNTSQSKLDVPKPVRRNSITEGTFNSQSDSEGPIRIKRSLSTGKESKIMTALGKVRQSILNSPYYNPRKCVDSVLTEYAKQSKTDLKGSGTELKRLSSVSYLKKPGKENVKP